MIKYLLITALLCAVTSAAPKPSVGGSYLSAYPYSLGYNSYSNYLSLGGYYGNYYKNPYYSGYLGSPVGYYGVSPGYYGSPLLDTYY
ncbi:hypothetical protein FQR65_LT07166 [Abscondita terminalis]|nr:hypothetical protein FQR65_LT07166 [Abscondita terminalis]